jgi:drug/metabolite transporter (DMT)-like permease
VVPPLVVLMSWLLLAESPAILSLIGGAVCLAGVAVATFVKRGTGAGSAAEVRDRDRARV